MSAATTLDDPATDTRALITQLYFVYAANSGTIAAVIDSTKKMLRLNGCSLCAITHGLAGEKKDWQECKTEIGVPVEYVHLNEITPKIEQAAKGVYPCIVADTDDGRTVTLLGPESLERCKGSVADLKGRLRTNATMQALRFDW